MYIVYQPVIASQVGSPFCKAENHMTDYFVPVSDRTGKKIVYYFLNTQRIFVW